MKRNLCRDISPLDRQIDQTNTQPQKTTTNQKRRPANLPARLAFRQRKNKANSKTKPKKQNGARAQTKHPRNRFATRCSGFHCLIRKSLLNELISDFKQAWRHEQVYYLLHVPSHTKKGQLSQSQHSLRLSRQTAFSQSARQTSIDRVVTMKGKRQNSSKRGG